MNISAKLFQELVAFLTPLPCFYDENARRSLLLTAGLSEILSQINCAGTSQTFVPLLLEFIDQYGNIGEQPALCWLLIGVTEWVGTEKRMQLADFCNRIRAQKVVKQQLSYEKYFHATTTQHTDFKRKMTLERNSEWQRSKQVQQFQQRSIGVKPNVEKLFVDREVYLKHLTEAVTDESVRLVLIVGQGGMGKTALAAKFCRDIEKAGYCIPLLENRITMPTNQSETSRDGSIRAIVYISRAELQAFSLDHALYKLLQSLDVEASKRVTPILNDPRAGAIVKTEAMLDMLRNGLTLLVLDNFETLLENNHIRNPEIAAFLETTCANQHGLKIIITSRYDLPLTAFESVRRIHLNTGIRLTEAVDLLRRLGKTVESISIASDSELEQLANVVYCVPMALKSLVGFLRIRRLITVSHLLLDASRFAEFKQHDVSKGLRKLIAEQYSLLSSEQQLTLQALAVFNAPVASVAVQALFPGIDADATLEALAYQLFLVQHNRITGQFDLHPSVCEYAYEQITLSSPSTSMFSIRQEKEQSLPHIGETSRVVSIAQLHSKAADFYVQMKKPKTEWKQLPDVQPHLDEITQRIAAGEYDLAAQVLTEIDFDYLLLWGYYQHVIALRKHLRENLANSHMKMLNEGHLGITYWATGYIKEAIPFIKNALKIAQKDHDKQNEGRWLGNLGIMYADLGEIHQAIDYYTHALTIAKEICDRRNEGLWLGTIGKTYAALGKTQQAIEYYIQAITLARKTGDKRREGIWLGNLGKTYVALGETQQGIEYYMQAMDLAKEIGDKRREEIWLGNLGKTYAALGEIQESIEYYMQAIIIAREIGDKGGEGICLGNLGNAYLELCVHEQETKMHSSQAIEYHQQALKIHQEMQDAKRIPEGWKSLGIAVFFVGKIEESKGYFQQCLTSCNTTLNNTQFYEVLYHKAFALLALQTISPDIQPPETALTAYKQALAVCAASGVVNEQIHEIKRWQQICVRHDLLASLTDQVLALLCRDIKV